MPIAKTSATIPAFGGSSMSASAANANENAIITNCAVTSSRRRSRMSASSPPVVDRNNRGPSWAKKMRPTKLGEPDSFRAKAPSVTVCIHVPMLDANVPR